MSGHHPFEWVGNLEELTHRLRHTVRHPPVRVGRGFPPMLYDEKKIGKTDVAFGDRFMVVYRVVPVHRREVTREFALIQRTVTGRVRSRTGPATGTCSLEPFRCSEAAEVPGNDGGTSSRKSAATRSLTATSTHPVNHPACQYGSASTLTTGDGIDRLKPESIK